MVIVCVSFIKVCVVNCLFWLGKLLWKCLLWFLWCLSVVVVINVVVVVIFLIVGLFGCVVLYFVIMIKVCFRLLVWWWIFIKEVIVWWSLVMSVLFIIWLLFLKFMLILDVNCICKLFEIFLVVFCVNISVLSNLLDVNWFVLCKFVDDVLL